MNGFGCVENGTDEADRSDGRIGHLILSVSYVPSVPFFDPSAPLLRASDPRFKFSFGVAAASGIDPFEAEEYAV